MCQEGMSDMTPTERRNELHAFCGDDIHLVTVFHGQNLPLSFRLMVERWSQVTNAERVFESADVSCDYSGTP